MKFDTLPQTCLVDEIFAIRVLELQPGARITLKLWSSFNDVVLLSSATFTADSNGVVDPSGHAPVSGSYQGVDAMGLFWSRALVHGDVAKGFEGMSKDPLTATLTVEGEDGAPPVSHPIKRVFGGPGVVSREVRDRGLVGKMFEPDQPGPHRAVLVVGGSNGGLAWSQEMAALLASHGHAALALAYFAAEGLPPTLDRIPLEYFGTALEWLSAQTTVAANKIGVVGVSRGGELALLLGATYPEIRAVVAYVPSAILWPAYPESGHGAWTLGGQEIPYAKTLTYEQWDKALAAGSAREDSFDWYPVSGEDMDMGGTPEGTARARQDSWPRMLAFLRCALVDD